MSESRAGKGLRVTRCCLLGAGLLGLCLMATGRPAGAQSWPSDAGPRGDMLGLTLRQFERLDPPPIEAVSRAERVVPNLSPADLMPSGSVDVGLPVLGRSLAAPGSDRAYRPAPAVRRPILRRQARRGTPGARPVVRAAGEREKELSRELADRDRQIQTLQREIEDSRRREQEPRALGSSLFGVNPAAAATVTPR
ncbi:hypothetical protein D9599_16465 [Roseomonas sp. KE2513]|uniref:hypothetical protein n=1 Tax=Roseomonas sp. KE2513 TaxID=2479202 RepID=UPI0018E02648|nr:hypothetical protein [Roseomonas sp. KE2513]MBI0537167.1 hypothetical protein [Roseomonas sp. KE2513]